MSDTDLKEYTFALPKDTADLFDKLCYEQPRTPASNLASRCIRDGIEALTLLHVEWSSWLNHTPHPMSVAARLQNFDRIEALEQENKRLREALEWYGEHAAGCRLIHSGGDASRHKLQDDGGKRARAALEEGKQ